VQPFLIDLESANGSKLNGEQIEPARYYQILEKDVLKLGESTRDYVFMSK